MTAGWDRRNRGRRSVSRSPAISRTDHSFSIRTDSAPARWPQRASEGSGGVAMVGGAADRVQPMGEKIIVTNAGALKRKYGRTGYSAVLAALRRLVAADRARGLRTRVVSLDSVAAMRSYRGRAVTDAADAKQNKDAVDAIVAKSRPDYVLILGSVDVVPHQDLANPLYSTDDPDRHAFGDLPYACEAPYSRRINDFIGPTRVIGRLPDLTGATAPDYLVSLIDRTAAWRSLPRAEYEKPFAVTAKVWEGSTRLTLRALFRSETGVRLSPPRGPAWSGADLERRVHLVNCHGVPASAEFYGDDGRSYPVSHRAAHVAGRIRPGTVAAVECCYGAELYDPSLLPGVQPGIANVYLREGAYGYLGSTTIAYGESDSTGAADLVCQYFLAGVLAGASLGRAALEALQRYAREDTDLDPVDLKTLAQFVLLGDPSIHPVVVPKAPVRKRAGAAAAPAAVAPAPKRQERRLGLLRKGLGILQTQGTAVRGRTAPLPSVRSLLEQEIRRRKLVRGSALNFAVAQPVLPVATRSGAKLTRAAAGPPASFHVMFARGSDGPLDEGPVTVLVAKEVAGEVVSFRALQRR